MKNQELAVVGGSRIGDGWRIRIGLAVLGGVLPVLVGCSPPPAPVSGSSGDPSNPSAPEGMVPLPATSAPAAVPSAASEDHDHMNHGMQPGVPMQHGDGMGSMAAGADAGMQAMTYVCPMHPEVTSTSRGNCPKCNMKLVPKK